MEENDAPITRFYYDKTADKFHNKRFSKGLSLFQLQHRYADAQLLIFGNGERFAYSNPFESWRNKIILTPKLLDNWSSNEEALEQHFRAVPVDIEIEARQRHVLTGGR